MTMRSSANSRLSHWAVLILILLICRCSPAARIVKESEAGVSPSVAIPSENQIRLEEKHSAPHRDEKVTDVQGREALLMKASLDENGEMVAQDEIEPAVKVENFRNVAERGGGVDLRFTITAPASLTDGMLQLRFTPRLLCMGDTLDLDRFFITGEGYRSSQLRSYERYERYLRSLITDSTAFIDKRELEIFIQRLGDVPQQDVAQIVEHFTDKLGRDANSRRVARKDEVFRRMVPSPILTEALRLDTVIRGDGQRIAYEYVQRFSAPANVRKVELSLCGAAYDTQDRKVLEFERCGPLTYYISSLSTLAIFPEQRASDSIYVRGYELLMERKYREAITLLAAYSDYNSALAHCALNYNDKALAIAESLPSCARVEYLKAILYSRKDDDFAAFGAYTKACSEDRSYVHRANLDPEILRIKTKYNINR